MYCIDIAIQVVFKSFFRKQHCKAGLGAREGLGKEDPTRAEVSNALIKCCEKHGLNLLNQTKLFDSALCTL